MFRLKKVAEMKYKNRASKEKVENCAGVSKEPQNGRRRISWQ